MQTKSTSTRRINTSFKLLSRIFMLLIFGGGDRRVRAVTGCAGGRVDRRYPGSRHHLAGPEKLRPVGGPEGRHWARRTPL